MAAAAPSASAAVHATDAQAMQDRVRQLYDYDRIVAKAPSADDLEWVFGYGSILFKQGFAAGQRVEGYLQGWRRVFYQLSTDHRGVPEAPGRTVTLIPQVDARTWGIAYKLPDDRAQRQAALQELEWREKQYDRKVFAAVYGADGEQLLPRVLAYVGSDDPAANVNWGGAATQDELAEKIAHAHGPSGPNSEYLFKLADGLRALQKHQERLPGHEDIDDAHVFDLEQRVRHILENSHAPQR